MSLALLLSSLLLSQFTYAESAAEIRLKVEPLFQKCLEASRLKRTNLQQAEILMQQEEAEFKALTVEYPLDLLQEHAGSLLNRCDSIAQSIKRAKASKFVERALQYCDSAKILVRDGDPKRKDIESLQTLHSKYITDLKIATAIHGPVLESALYKGQVALCEEVSQRVLSSLNRDNIPTAKKPPFINSIADQTVDDQAREINTQLKFTCEKLKQMVKRGDRKEADALMVRMASQMDTLLDLSNQVEDRLSLSNNLSVYKSCLADAENSIRALAWQQQQRQDRKQKLREELLGTIKDQEQFISQCTVKILTLKEFMDIEWFLKEPDRLQFKVNDTALQKITYRARLYRNKEFPRLANTIDQNQTQVINCKKQYKQGWEKRYAWLLKQQEQALAEANHMEIEEEAEKSNKEEKSAIQVPESNPLSVYNKAELTEEAVPLRENRKDDLELSPKRPDLISRRDSSELIPGGK